MVNLCKKRSIKEIVGKKERGGKNEGVSNGLASTTAPKVSLLHHMNPTFYFYS